ncbi:hypothetical protein Tco_0044468 [Tanacetum coccineum]
MKIELKLGVNKDLEYGMLHPPLLKGARPSADFQSYPSFSLEKRCGKFFERIFFSPKYILGPRLEFPSYLTIGIRTLLELLSLSLVHNLYCPINPIFNLHYFSVVSRIISGDVKLAISTALQHTGVIYTVAHIKLRMVRLNARHDNVIVMRIRTNG